MIERGHGTATVTVNVGPPVNATAMIQVNAYPAFYINCSGINPAQPSYSFTAAGATYVAASKADLYLTENPPVIFPPPPGGDVCVANGLAVPQNADTIVHFPYGGVFIGGDLGTFEGVTAAQWQPTTTSVPLPGTLGTLLFKTAQGAIVKAMIPMGPFEVSVNGSFPY